MAEVWSFGGRVRLSIRQKGVGMRWQQAASGRLLGPFERQSLVAPTAASHRLGWTGLEAARFSDVAGTEFERPALTHHSLILFTKPPLE